MIYIVTNRKILPGTGPDGTGETINNDGQEHARPVFRIATAEPDPKKADRFVARLVPDEFVESYDDLAPEVPLDQVFGSRRMFLDLYRRMTAAPAEKGDTLVMLHGFQYTFEASLEHIAKLNRVYLEPEDSPIAHLVYFSWPSCGRLTEYKDDQVDVKAVLAGRSSTDIPGRVATNHPSLFKLGT